MKYIIEEWTIGDLILLYEENKLNLNPPYQRNDIWSTANKSRLIDSIKSGYPLPMFFLHRKEDKYDMVDGQQRTRTIIGYKKDVFGDLEKIKYSSSNRDLIDQFRIGVTIITEENDESVLQDFYYRVNKFGTKLNRPEILKAQYFDTPFQNLVEELSELPDFHNLNLFSETSLRRMNDMDFVAELLTLTKHGITEKKVFVDKLFADETIGEDEIIELKQNFLKFLKIILELNNLYRFSRTRYCQRNDFYTLWSLLQSHDSIDKSLIEHFYKILVVIDPDISPTNEKCFSFQSYATNCVSQSNSKRAREERLRFFEGIIFNIDSAFRENGNEVIQDILNYYTMQYSDLQNVFSNYFLPKISVLNSKSSTPINFANDSQKQ